MTFDLDKARAICNESLAEIERLRALRTDILQALGRPKTASDQGILLYVRGEVDYNRTQAARIQELEDALIEERARALWFEGDDPCDPPNLDWKTEPNDIPESVRLLWGESARKQLRAEGKIGPDARIAAWQITEERKAALKRLYGLLVIRYKYSYPDETETLRAMLEEVEE